MGFKDKIEPCLVKSDFTAKRTHRQTRKHSEKDAAIKSALEKEKFDNVKNRKENLKNNN